MIIPRKLHVENWATWRQGSIPLDVPGITFVRGRNMDAGGNPNAAGKSSMFNALYALTFGDHQLATRKKSLKSVTRDHTRIRCVCDVDDARVVGDLKGTDLKVLVNGDRVESRVKNADRTQLLKLLNTTPELWSSTVHVNGIASNPLVRGTSSSRCQFLEKAFDLDRWADIHGAVGDALSAMKRVQTDLASAKADLGQIDDSDPRRIRAKLDHMERVTSKLSHRSARARERAAVARHLPPQPEHSVEHYENLVTRLDKEYVACARDARQEDAWREASDRRDALRDQLKSVPQGEPRGLDVDKLTAQVTKLTTTCEDIRFNREDVIPNHTQWFAVAKIVAKKYGLCWREPEDLRSISNSWIANLRDGDNECPVCGSALKREIDARDLQELKKCAARLGPGQLVLEETRDENEVREKRDYLAARVSKELKLVDAQNRREQLRRELSQIRVPPRPRDPGDVDGLRKRLERARSDLSDARQWAKTDVRGDPDRLRRVSEHLDAKFRKAVNRCAELSSQHGEARSNAERRRALRERVAGLEAELIMQPAYRALHQAYSPTGMRLWLLSELLEAIIAGLNEAVRTARDRIEFGYRLGRNRDLTLTATNMKGTFDVRMLSGAEGNLFCLTLLTVLLPLLPSRRRCNLLILDEMDANCSQRTVDLIAQEYLPRLRRVCGTLMVVTPATEREFNVRGASNLIIEKHGGESRVLEYRHD